MTWTEALLFLGAGAGGGLLRHLLSKGGLVLPRITTIRGERLLRMGFLASMVIGAGVGLLIDNSPITAFTTGYAGPHALEKLIGKGILNGKK